MGVGRRSAMAAQAAALALTMLFWLRGELWLAAAATDAGTRAQGFPAPVGIVTCLRCALRDAGIVAVLSPETGGGPRADVVLDGRSLSPLAARLALVPGAPPFPERGADHLVKVVKGVLDVPPRSPRAALPVVKDHTDVEPEARPCPAAALLRLDPLRHLHYHRINRRHELPVRLLPTPDELLAHVLKVIRCRAEKLPGPRRGVERLLPPRARRVPVEAAPGGLPEVEPPVYPSRGVRAQRLPAEVVEDLHEGCALPALPLQQGLPLLRVHLGHVDGLLDPLHNVPAVEADVAQRLQDDRPLRGRHGRVVRDGVLALAGPERRGAAVADHVPVRADLLRN
mmetsp:Transcript_31545/g.74977  ORF Transcript_31545/g.74977 Transcript_31545/m.74977 type:complete len:340 (+) Transcript_31545:350-1369(+)